ncbi:MAG: carotenoid oxygenase family protein [Xenococcus sp. (in: cyanobacteria)]
MKELIPESKKLIVESTKKINYTTDHSKSPRFPKAAFSVSREEFYQEPLELIVQQRSTEVESTDCSSEDLLSDKYWKASQLPADLHGHVFIMGVVGYFGSVKQEGSEYVVEPTKVDQDTEISNCLLNGDGMIYRLDFHQTPCCHATPEVGKAWMATRIIKTPDHYADLALWRNGEKNEYKERWPDEYPKLKFNNFYLSRVSIKLGNRNFLNTAFLPMKFSNGSERLLVTWDVGRPYEIDPRTLGLCAPIGWNSEWDPMIPSVANDLSIFPLTLSSAHPAFDTHTDEMFTVNASKSFTNLVWISRLLSFDAQEFADHYLKLPLLKNLFKLSVKVLAKLLNYILEILEDFLDFLGIESRNAVYIKRWKGEGTSVDKWQVLKSNGRPIKIKQCLHQMDITKDYIVLSDSAFKLVLQDLLPSFSTKNPILKDLEKFLSSIGDYLTYPQLNHTRIYIVPRNQLKPGVTTVKAKEVKLTPETAHFKVDYENPDGKIILHAAHTAATDPAQFLSLEDKSIYDDKKITEELTARAGMIGAPMDANRLGSWTIDVANETCKVKFVSDEKMRQHLWLTALYAWRGFQPEQFTDIYWNCWGAWEELLSDLVFEMYKNYKKRLRLVRVKEVKEIVKKGKPANLLRMHIERKGAIPDQLTIKDIYNFPPGFFGNSPTFVPRQGTDDPTDGYLICTVLHSENSLSELWIFDAKDLKAGPRYRLSHPDLNMGLTLHTTWLSKLETPPAREDYDLRRDYHESVEKTNSEAIKTLFEKDVYPYFDKR